MFYSEAADINDPELGKDPSMPRTKRKCPWCGYDEAVYYFKAGPEQKNIVIQYICNSESCKIVIVDKKERTRYWTKEDEGKNFHDYDEEDDDMDVDI
ncbi:hypothetical protein IMG5_072550 [Ichthyophthirius multifiliis]|uniref:Uncharacterized protein n=1 Tax=Ichthyophthirius multifiliis TaxID=5932 RepID=G0QPX9_ICHMU|nr:hypothetical protein IMG5_072550 [Ichthyophthirius multifiliis]EGR32727.1 hypothetical protein IMG5_072550 [Ichthyophthirius multifiliis]|eukprot:XP_004036713.1 hypothetical protein IMG5_072550 [Ichthyophthirius multifiliis]